jgi:2-polyprenyl-3-methyl-5-hydroxy-6-metoxy-1,4-benzoquinol methylase
MLLAMQSPEGTGWDRDADLELIREVYGHYGEVGRDRLWSRDNRGFSRLSDTLREQLIREIEAVVPRGDARVLDLGCGSGELGSSVATSGVHTEWVGVDLRAEAILEARSIHPAGTYHVASADDVPEASNSFDVVVAQLLFSSLPSRDLEASVAVEIQRLLRPAGWLVWCDLRLSNPMNPAVHAISTGRLHELFPRWTVTVRPAGLLPPLARRLGIATPVLYPVLSAISPLRSHLVGRLQPPGIRLE